MNKEKENLVKRSQKIQLDTIAKLSEIIPSSYNGYQLEYIILAKACSFYVPFDILLTRYLLLSNRLEKLLFSPTVSKYIAYQRTKIHLLLSSKPYTHLKNETNLDLDNYNNSLNNIDPKRSYNLFFANLRQYLRPIVQYLKYTELDNHLLLIPKHFKDYKILQDINSKSIIYFEDFITNEIINDYEESKLIFKKILESKQGFLEKLFHIDGYPFWEIFKPGFQNIFKYALPEALLYSKINEILFNSININSVVGVRMRRMFDRAIHIITKKNNIKSYIMPHANINGELRLMHKTGHFNHITSVFGWGDKQRQAILNDDLSDVKSVHITGSPLFDGLVKEKVNANNFKRILYAASRVDKKSFKSVLNTTLNSSLDINLIVKGHPGEPDDIYQRYQNNDKVEIVPSSDVIEDIIPNSDLVITEVSQSIWVAMKLEIPVIFMVIHHKKFYEQYLNNIYMMNEVEEDTLLVNTEIKLRRKINGLFTSEEKRKTHLRIQNEFIAQRIQFGSKKNHSSNIIDNILKNKGYSLDSK